MADYIKDEVRKLIPVIVALVALTAIVAGVRYYLVVNTSVGASYRSYVIDGAEIILALVATFLAYKIVMYLVVKSLGKRMDHASIETVATVLRIVFYAVAIIAVLLSLGVNISAALAGGAIGGVVLGLAVQTVATNLLSGMFVASSRVLKPGDLVIINTGAWGAVNPMVWGEVTCTISRIGMLWTTAENQYGNTMLIPNSILLGNILFTKLKYPEGYRYVKLVTVNADVQGDKIRKGAENELEGEFSKRKLKPPEIHYFSKNGGTVVFSVTIKFNDGKQLTELIDLVNGAFDRAYWKAKA